MISQIFFALGAILFVASVYLIRTRVSHARRRGDPHLKTTRYRFIGVLLLFPTALSLIIGYAYYSSADHLPEGLMDSIHTKQMEEKLRKLKAAKSPESATMKSGSDRWISPDGSTVRPLDLATPFAADDEADKLREAREEEADMKMYNVMLRANPNDAITYANRGVIYAKRKLWDQAEDDFRSALKIDGKMTKAAFDLAEMEFEQKRYDSARPGFVALKSDPNLGDIATYKVFLCDLIGGRKDLADKELEALNQAETGASFYFANIAWFLDHGKIDDARDWLDSANRIYPKYKTQLYSSSLTDLGFMPIPPKQ